MRLTLRHLSGNIRSEIRVGTNISAPHRLCNGLFSAVCTWGHGARWRMLCLGVLPDVFCLRRAVQPFRHISEACEVLSVLSMNFIIFNWINNNHFAQLWKLEIWKRMFSKKECLRKSFVSHQTSQFSRFSYSVSFEKKLSEISRCK